MAGHVIDWRHVSFGHAHLISSGAETALLSIQFDEMGTARCRVSLYLVDSWPI
jgi:hypothetical protein